VNLLDENIPDAQRLLLRRWRIPVRQIGQEVGRGGMSDDEIVTLLMQLRRPTFFTRDSDFHRRDFCHERYCLAWLSVEPSDVAEFARRLLRHRDYNTQAKRMGSVIAITPSGLSVWRPRAERETHVPWTTGRRR
jgi:hypothetical protein